MIQPNEPSHTLTIRGHIATQAMKGLLSQHMTQETESGAPDLEPLWSNKDNDTLARCAVAIADALIAELNKQPTKDEE